MYSSDDHNEGGYESYGDYEPHTGDPKYDLEYDRSSYYKMPDMVKKFLVYFRNMINEGVTYEILNLYENTFPKLTEQYFENTPWPEENEVAPVVDNDQMEAPKKQNLIKTNKKAVLYTEDTLKKALNAIRNEGKGIRETCRLYQIPRTTIQDRLSGKRRDCIEAKGPDPVVGVEGEKQIKEWLLTIAKCGFPVKKQELLDTVQKIVKDHGKKTPFKDDRPGQTWYQNFLKRHPDISCRAAEGINKARARVSEESIRAWFKELKEFLKETNNLDILESPERIFNGDESGFSMCPKTGKVLAPKGYRNLYQIKAGNEKDNLTVLITFNASGQLSPPLVVFPYIRPPRAVVESMPEDWCLGKSESGWMRSDVFFEYITNEFNSWVERNSIKKPILLLIDGHKSHMSLVLSAMCEKLGIILYALPPNTTHMLQPADVSVFGPLKSSWKSVVRKFLAKPENVNSCVNKTNFCRLFRDTLQDTNMKTNIINGFKKCGLYPFNPDSVDYSKCVQNTIENVQQRPTQPSNTITNTDLATTRKVLKHLRPVLKSKKINVSVILKELRKLRTKTQDQGTDSEDITDNSVNQSTSFQMECSTEGVVITDPSLPILTDITDILSCTTDQNRDVTSYSENNTTGSHVVIINRSKEASTTDDRATEVPMSTHPVEETHFVIRENETADDSLSTLHLTGANASSYLEVGSLVSLDDVVIIPSASTSKSDSFSKHLFIPDPPQRAKPKQFKTPAAISSGAWRSFYEEKENLKAEKQTAILKRKQVRAEATRQKKLKRDKKSQATIALVRNKKNNESVLKELCTECEDILISDVEEDDDKNVGCDFCQRWYHLKCTSFAGSAYVDIVDKTFKCKICSADKE